MKYRLTIQPNKNNNEKSVIIIDNKEDAKMEYLKSCEKDYFTQLERCRCGEWERIMFQIEQGQYGKGAGLCCELCFKLRFHRRIVQADGRIIYTKGEDMFNRKTLCKCVLPGLKNKMRVIL